MNDMSSIIVPKSDQMNADSLLGAPRTITITGVEIRPGQEQPCIVHYDGEDGRPWKPCKSMARVLVSAWGLDAKEYVGKSLTLYHDPKVKWGGMEVGGIRISHMSHIENDMVMALTATKGKRVPYKVQVLRSAPAAPPAQPAPEIPESEARAAIEAAADLDALKKVWTSAAMRPHREALQPVLDVRKAALEPKPEPTPEPETAADDIF